MVFSIIGEIFPLLTDLDAFLLEFTNTFSETDRARTETTKLRSLQQRSRAASVYAAEFRQLACDVDWDDNALISAFRWELRDDVKDLLLNLPDPTSLSESITQAVRCDNRLFERRQERQSISGPYRADAAMPTKSSTTTTSMPEPMQIDASRIKKLTPKEKERRRQKDLYYVLRRKGTSSPQLSSKGCKPKTLQVSIHLHESRRWTYSFTFRKQRCPATLGTMRLANNAQSTGPILSSEPSTCFTIPFRVKFDDHNIKVSALLDSGASACFIDKDFAERHKLPLVTKKWPVSIEVIDGRPLVSGDVTKETKALDIYIDQHRSTVVFNVVKSPTNAVILGLS